MARPCVGCGFTVDVSGYLQAKGVTSVAYPYTAATTTPNDLFCDTTSGELWVKPWAVPWGILDVETAALAAPGQVISSTTITNVSGSRLQFTVPANRRIRISAQMTVDSQTTDNIRFLVDISPTATPGAGIPNAKIADTTIPFATGTSNGYVTISSSYVFTSTATSYDLSTSITKITATGSVRVRSDAGLCQFVAEDVGPA